MITVKPEIDEQHLRLRARWAAWLRASSAIGNGKAPRREDLDIIVIHGGKGKITSRDAEPTAA